MGTHDPYKWMLGHAHLGVEHYWEEVDYYPYYREVFSYVKPPIWADESWDDNSFKATVDPDIKAFYGGEAGEDLTQYARVRWDGNNNVVMSDAGETSIGFIDQAYDIGNNVTIIPFRPVGTCLGVAANSLAKDATLYQAEAGQISDTVSGNPIGTALEAATASGDEIQYLPEGATGCLSFEDYEGTGLYIYTEEEGPKEVRQPSPVPKGYNGAMTFLLKQNNTVFFPGTNQEYKIGYRSDNHIIGYEGSFTDIGRISSVYGGPQHQIYNDKIVSAHHISDPGRNIIYVHRINGNDSFDLLAETYIERDKVTSVGMTSEYVVAITDAGGWETVEIEVFDHDLNSLNKISYYPLYSWNGDKGFYFQNSDTLMLFVNTDYYMGLYDDHFILEFSLPDLSVSKVEIPTFPDHGGIAGFHMQLYNPSCLLSQVWDAYRLEDDRYIIQWSRDGSIVRRKDITDDHEPAIPLIAYGDNYIGTTIRNHWSAPFIIKIHMMDSDWNVLSTTDFLHDYTIMEDTSASISAMVVIDQDYLLLCCSSWRLDMQIFVMCKIEGDDITPFYVIPHRN